MKTCWIVLIFIFEMFASCNDGTSKNNKNGRDNSNIIHVSYDSSINDLSTSTNMFQVLCQGWENEDDIEILRNEKTSLQNVFRSFYLSADGSFIKNPRNQMEYGKWAYDDDNKTMLFYNTLEGGKDLYKIAALASDELQIVNKGIKSTTLLKYLASKNNFIQVKDDPYHINNNLWRIKPNASESDSAIKKRLKDNLHFLVLYYQSTITKSSSMASVLGFPSCLKFYAGAIYLTKKKELDDNWINCFYNKTQALKAYAIMEKIFSKKIKWPDNQNLVQQNIAGINQIEKFIDEAN